MADLHVPCWRPGDTILIAAGGSHVACNIQIKKPICIVSLPSMFLSPEDVNRDLIWRMLPALCTKHLFFVGATVNPFYFHQIGGGDLPDDTVLTCSRGFDK